MLKRTPQLLFSRLVSFQAKKPSLVPKNWLPNLSLNSFSLLFQLQPQIYHFSSNSQRRTEYQEEDLVLFNHYQPEKVPKMRKVMEKYLQCKDLSLLTSDEIKLIYEVLGSIGTHYVLSGEQDKGQRYLKEYEGLNKNMGTRDTTDLAANFYLQANAYLERNDLQNAQHYLTEAERICKSFKDDPEAKHLLVQIYCSFAQLSARQNNLDQALKLYQSIIEKASDIFEEERARMILFASQEMGNIYSSRNNIEKATENYARCLETQIKYSGEENSKMAYVFSQQLASFLYQNDQYQNALPYAKQGLNIALQVFPQDHPEIALSYSKLGHIYAKDKKLPKALESFKEAVQIFEKHPPQEVADFLYKCYFQSGRILALQGSPQEASSYLAKAGSSVALTLQGKQLADKYFEWATELNVIGNVMEDTKSYFLKALEIFESSEPSNPGLIPYIYASLGNITFWQQDWEKACEFGKKAESFFEAGGMQPDDIQNIYTMLSRASVNLGNLDDGLKYCQKVLQSYEITKNPRNVSEAYFHLGLIYEHEEKLREALEAFQKSLEFQEATGPPAHLINEKILEINRKI